MIKIAGSIDAYVATPAEGTARAGDVGILYLPDVIGVWQNSKLLADAFARSGYLTVVVDLFNGDPVPLNQPEGFDLKAWLAKGSDGRNPHTAEAVDPIVQKAVEAMRGMGVKHIGSVGYCFGGKVCRSPRPGLGLSAARCSILLFGSLSANCPVIFQYVVRHYKTGIEVGYCAHPSFIGDDELAGITGPLSISAAETDRIFPADLRHKSEGILAKTGQPYQINLFSGTSHGFAVRGDPAVKAQKFAKEQAFLQAVTWFDNYLG